MPALDPSMYNLDVYKQQYQAPSTNLNNQLIPATGTWGSGSGNVGGNLPNIQSLSPNWIENVANSPGIMTGLGALGSLVGSIGYKNALSSGYGDAAQAISNAGQQGININLGNLEEAMRYYEPYYQAGVSGLEQYQNLPTGAAGLPNLPSPDIPFEFNPQDQQYQIMQADLAKQINQQAAARGMYNSSPTQNILADQYRRLQAAEVQNQYNRAVDTYNRQYQQGTALWDAENILAQNNLNRSQNLMLGGQRASSDITNALTRTGENVANLYGTIGQAQANAALGQGQTQAGMWQDLASLPVEALSTYKLLSGQGTNALSSGLINPEAGMSSGATNALSNVGATGAATYLGANAALNAGGTFGAGAVGSQGGAALGTYGVGGAADLTSTIGTDAAAASSLSEAPAGAGGASVGAAGAGFAAFALGSYLAFQNNRGTSNLSPDEFLEAYLLGVPSGTQIGNQTMPTVDRSNVLQMLGASPGSGVTLKKDTSGKTLADYILAKDWNKLKEIGYIRTVTGESATGPQTDLMPNLPGKQIISPQFDSKDWITKSNEYNISP